MSTQSHSWSADGRRWSIESNEDSTDVEIVIDDRVQLSCSRPALELFARRALAVLGVRPLNAGKRWSEDADDDLRRAFESDDSPAELAEQFGRTVLAIQARLAHLGLIEDNGSYRRYVVRRQADAET